MSPFHILGLYDLLLPLHFYYFTNFIIRPYIVRISSYLNHLYYIHYYFQTSNSYLLHSSLLLSMCYYHNWISSYLHFHYIHHLLHLMLITLLIHYMLSYCSLLPLHSHLSFLSVHSYLSNSLSHYSSYYFTLYLWMLHFVLCYLWNSLSVVCLFAIIP